MTAEEKLKEGTMGKKDTIKVKDMKGAKPKWVTVKSIKLPPIVQSIT